MLARCFDVEGYLLDDLADVVRDGVGELSCYSRIERKSSGLEVLAKS